MRVFLADLGHDQLTISSDVYPLGVANLATYLAEYHDTEADFDIRIFRSPAELRAALDEQAPEVLGLSSYAWNHNLAMQFARYAKALRPDTLTVLGGPNFPLTMEEQESYLRTLTDIDVASRGPTYESERAFLNLMRRFVEVGGSIDGLLAKAVQANVWVNHKTGEFVHGGEIPRIPDLDEIPSPYLAGLMDPYLDSGLFPLLQIARGCPFSCTFCNSATKENNRIFRHSTENIKTDLMYLADRVPPETALCFSDDNFGMYPQDEEIAEFLGELQDTHGWPKYIRTTTGKNRGDRIIRVMRKAKGAMPMTSAVQSLNPIVLKNIKRDNISLETYRDIQREVIGQGMQAYGELILCLPGETKASFLDAVDRLLETGVKRVSAHQLMLLHGAPLANPDQRERFGFKTRFRVVARNVGDYLDEPVVETEEIVVETPEFSFEDYLECRVFHLLLTIFFYEGNFEEAFAWTREQGVRPYRVIRILQGLLDSAPAAFRGMI
ncbi:MAG: B12-binding domain-containing radical SAM protein, partial [Thermoanaerobaculia bacterium]